MKTTGNGDQTTLDLGHLETGKYIIRITNDTKVRHDQIQLIK